LKYFATLESKVITFLLSLEIVITYVRFFTDPNDEIFHFFRI